MTYSLDFRKQVLKSLDNGMTFAEVAVFYDISPTTIQKWKKRLHSRTTRNVTARKIPDEALRKDVEDYPDSYHYERAARLNCSASGICEALKRLGISKKKILEHPNACPMKRVEFNAKLHYFKQQGFPIIYIDESGFEHETIRRYGYAPIGKPCIDSIIGKVKSEQTLLGLCMNRRYLPWSLLKRTLIGA